MFRRLKGEVKVKNPSEVLVYQDGVFELTSPSGDIFHVTCHRGMRMTFTQTVPNRKKEGGAREGTNWRIRPYPPEG